MARKLSDSPNYMSTTVEARERQMIALAVDLAEKQLREGTASAAVIQHYLKLGATDYPLRMERLQRQNELFAAKKEAIERDAQNEEIAKNAIEAMRRYSGNYGQEEYDEML